jgi:hypothetical protein
MTAPKQRWRKRPGPALKPPPLRPPMQPKASGWRLRPAQRQVG